MNLILQRQPIVGRSLPGDLFVDGARYSFTLENAALAIPSGSYRIVLTVSERAIDRMLWTPDNKSFRLPLLCDVPGRSGIRMHCANEYLQLEGCIAVGATWTGEWLGSSQRTFTPLFRRFLDAETRMDDIWIDVVDPVKPGGETKLA